MEEQSLVYVTLLWFLPSLKHINILITFHLLWFFFQVAEGLLKYVFEPFFRKKTLFGLLFLVYNCLKGISNSYSYFMWSVNCSYTHKILLNYKFWEVFNLSTKNHIKPFISHCTGTPMDHSELIYGWGIRD